MHIDPGDLECVHIYCELSLGELSCYNHVYGLLCASLSGQWVVCLLKCSINAHPVDLSHILKEPYFEFPLPSHSNEMYGLSTELRLVLITFQF